MDSQDSHTSLTLLERARSKNDEAWETIVQLYAPLVYRLCRVAQIQPDDAGDIVQKVFRSAFGHITGFRHDRPGDSFRAWLLTIAKNKICDHFRNRERKERAVGGSDMQRQLQQLPALDWNSTSDAGSFDSSSNLMQRAIKMVRGDFQDRTWQAFWEITVDGRAADDMAQRLGMSKWAVYQAKSRVLRRMREVLDGLIE